MEFQGADDWVLLSVINGGPGLRGIIAAGDGINHAIFNYEDLRAGLVRQTPKGWSAAPSAIRAIRVPGRGFKNQYDALGVLMDAAKGQKNAPRLRGLTPRTFEAVYQAYHKDFEGT